MEGAVRTQAARPPIKVSRVILPTEHGSWSFLLEPIVAGVGVASSWIALAAIGAFFARQPLKVFYVSRGNPQLSNTALRFLVLFLVVAAVGLGLALLVAGPWPLYPFVAAAPLALQQVFFDLSKRNRNLLAEISGAIAISSSVGALMLAGGAEWPRAMALWAVFVCRFVPSILYVRNRLQLEKGKPYGRLLPILSNLVGLGLVVALAAAGLASWLTVAVMAFLAARAGIGLSAYRTKMKAMKLGLWEVGYGAVFVLSVVVGYYLGV